MLFCGGLLASLERSLAEASRYGEIRDLLEAGWKLMGVPAIREQIRQTLEIQGLVIAQAENETRHSIAIGIAILFGLLVFPTFGQDVLQPLWSYLELPRPAAKDAFDTLTNMISLGTVGILVFAIVRISRLVARRGNFS